MIVMLRETVSGWAPATFVPIAVAGRDPGRSSEQPTMNCADTFSPFLSWTLYNDFFSEGTAVGAVCFSTGSSGAGAGFSSSTPAILYPAAARRSSKDCSLIPDSSSSRLFESVSTKPSPSVIKLWMSCETSGFSGSLGISSTSSSSD